MTQPPEPRRASSEGTPSGGLTSKIGPLPVWGWVALAAVGGVVVLLWLRSRNSAAAGSTTSTVSPDTATVANLQDQLATVTSQIRDLQGAGSVATNPATGPGTGPYNGIRPIHPVGAGGAPGGYHVDPGTQYIVKKGDSLSAIAAMFGRAEQEIVNANPGQTYAVGNTIVIPPVARNF